MTAQIKSDYKSFLSADPKGKQILITAIKMKRDWKTATNVTGVGVVTTENVKLKNLPPRLAKRAKLLTIEPIGLNNMCHITCKWMEQYGYKSQLGYNVTSCRCGKQTCMELHTVSDDGTLHDFTSDFNDEKTKWFIPLPVTFESSVFTKIHGSKRDFINVDTGCQCFAENILFDDVCPKKMTWNEVMDFFDLQSRYRISFV